MFNHKSKVILYKYFYIITNVFLKISRYVPKYLNYLLFSVEQAAPMAALNDRFMTGGTRRTAPHPELA